MHTARRRSWVCSVVCGFLFVCGRGFKCAESTEVGSSWHSLATNAGEWRIIDDGVPGALDSLGLEANLDFLGGGDD